MTTKRLACTLTAASLVASMSDTALGQPQNTRRPRITGHELVVNAPIAFLTKSLSLTTAQAAKIEAIRSRLEEEENALVKRNRARIDKQAGDSGQTVKDVIYSNRVEMGKLDHKARVEFVGVLNSKQRARLPELLNEFRALRGTRIPLELAADLKLTPDQVKRIGDLSDEREREMWNAFRVVGQSGDRTSMMRKVRALQADNDRKIVAILTAKQRAAVQKYGEAHPRPGPG